MLETLIVLGLVVLLAAAGWAAVLLEWQDGRPIRARGTLGVGALHGALQRSKGWYLVTGSVRIDDGAPRALRERGASLLPPGVVEVHGTFRAGDAIDVLHGADAGASATAKGVSQYDASELARIMGHGTPEIERLLGYAGSEVVIHRDDMVLL